MPKQYDNTPINEETTVSSEVLASCLGVSTRRIEQLTQEGHMIKAAEGEYRLIASISNYIKKQRLEIESAKADKTEDFKLRQEAAKAEKLEIELAELKGSLIEKSLVLSVFSEACVMLKTKLLAMPSKIAQTVRVAQDDKSAKQIVEKHVRTALSAIANIDLNDVSQTEQD